MLCYQWRINFASFKNTQNSGRTIFSLFWKFSRWISLRNMRESYHKLYRVLRPHNNISRKIIFSPHQPINFQPPFCWRTQEVYKKNESVLSIQILRSLLSSYSKILERILLTEKKRLTRCTTFDIPFRTNYPAHKFDPNLYFIPLGNISQCFLSTYLAN